MGVIILVQKAIPIVKNLAHVTANDLATQEQEAILQWTNTTNYAIASVESEINVKLLGWAYNGTQTVNNTLTTFMDDINTAIKNTFEDTPLDGIVSGVVFCTLGDKVMELQKGLTWVHNQAHVSFPKVNSSLLASNLSTSAITPSVEKAGSASSSILDSLVDSLWQTVLGGLYVSISLISMWLLYAIGGLVYCIWVYKRGKNSDNAPPTLVPPVTPSPSNEVLEQRWLTSNFYPPSLLTVPSPTHITQAQSSDQSLPLPSPVLMDNRKVVALNTGAPRKSTVASFYSRPSYYTADK
jgi:hypothetical protein